MDDRVEEGAVPLAGGESSPRGLRRILAVGMEPELYSRIESLLNRSYFEVDRVPSGESGRILCAAIPFDLVLVRFPLSDIDVADLLVSVRIPASPCAKAQVLLLADQARLSEAEGLVGRGADLLLAADRTGVFLSEIAARLLHVAPRVASRIMVRIQAQISDGDRQDFCQTVDLSASGMFVRTEERYPLGTTLTFQLMLPGENEAVVGTAAVVRHASGGQGTPDGIGLRYLALRPGSEARLRGFLARQLATP